MDKRIVISTISSALGSGLDLIRGKYQRAAEFSVTTDENSFEGWLAISAEHRTVALKKVDDLRVLGTKLIIRLVEADEGDMPTADEVEEFLERLNADGEAAVEKSFKGQEALMMALSAAAADSDPDVASVVRNYNSGMEAEIDVTRMALRTIKGLVDDNTKDLLEQLRKEDAERATKKALKPLVEAMEEQFGRLVEAVGNMEEEKTIKERGFLDSLKREIDYFSSAGVDARQVGDTIDEVNLIREELKNNTSVNPTILCAQVESADRAQAHQALDEIVSLANRAGELLSA